MRCSTCDAYARRHGQGAPFNVELNCDRGKYLLCDGTNGLLVAQPFEYHDELVSSQARDDIGRPNRVGQPMCELPEHRVAGGMAQVVVDRLEAVYIQEHQGDRRQWIVWLGQ